MVLRNWGKLSVNLSLIGEGTLIVAAGSSSAGHVQLHYQGDSIVCPNAIGTKEDSTSNTKVLERELLLLKTCVTNRENFQAHTIIP